MRMPSAHVSEGGPSWDLLTTAVLVVTLAWYLVGLRSGNRRIPVRGVVLYLLALASVALVLASPVEWYTEHLLVVHMAQHLVLMIFAAPLLVLANPLPVLLRPLPIRIRRCLARAFAAFARRSRDTWTWPVAAALLHLAAVALWHLPGPYTLAVRDDVVHLLMHLSFVGTALLFWWGVLERGLSREAYGLRLLLVGLAMLEGMAIGFFMVFAGTPWYPIYIERSVHFGVAPLVDQQAGGALMWAAGGLAYAAAGVTLVTRWLDRLRRDSSNIDLAEAAVT